MKPGSSEPARGDRHWPEPHAALLVALLTTGAVTAVSHLAPDDWANTAVGGIFLLVTWVLVLRHDSATVQRYGVSLGGLTEPVKLDPRRIGRDTLVALGWCLLMMAIFFPPFFFGYRYWWEAGDFALRWPADFGSRAMGQLLVIALPEEAFFRGYLQSSLDGAWKHSTRRILGAELGWGWLLSAAIFAVGHLLTIPHPSRLGVFFPALVFGYLRARTGGIGAGVLFHAACNLYSSLLAESFGLASG